MLDGRLGKKRGIALIGPSNSGKSVVFVEPLRGLSTVTNGVFFIGEPSIGPAPSVYKYKDMVGCDVTLWDEMTRNVLEGLLLPCFFQTSNSAAPNTPTPLRSFSLVGHH